MAIPDFSRRQARTELYDWPEVGQAIGFYGTGTLAAATLTDTIKLGGARSGHWFANQGQLVFPDNPQDQRYRDPGSLTGSGTGVLNLRGSAVTAIGAGKRYEFVKRGLSWDRINEAFFASLLDVYYMQRSSVGAIFDADFVQPDFDGWVVSHSDLLLEFDASAEYNDSGYYSMLLTYNGALDTRYLARAAHVRMEAGERFWLAGLCKIITGGPVYWDVYNETTGQAVRNRVTLTRTDEWFHVGGAYDAQSAGNYNLRLGAAHGTVVAWDCFPNHFTKGLSWDAPDYVSNRWELDRIDAYTYSRKVAQDVDMARSRQYTSLRRRVDFDVEVNAAEASPGRVQLLPPSRKSVPDADLFYRIKRAVADVYDPDENTPLPGDDSVRAQITAGFRIRVLGMLEERDRLGPNGMWQRKMRDLQSEQDAFREVEEEQPTPAREPNRRHQAV